ncbi:putative carbonic anhydrase-like protein 1 [Trichonephila inaurata madagascariensis]|uniref:Putative carbonic anhydrase-like protein 1 n=1 Tax=Trichonephila inaurata madagascariensis TaxID=2747483 RepID=A0A8X6YL64_9ARAC|nr:putative carbonic anhydrase-like protein 1 [Trichonephila inaurata madagascariensis]
MKNIYVQFYSYKGPDFWGLLNLEWSLCSKGRRQSPVDIDPNTLLFDPSLRNIQVDKIRIAISGDGNVGKVLNFDVELQKIAHRNDRKFYRAQVFFHRWREENVIFDGKRNLRLALRSLILFFQSMQPPYLLLQLDIILEVNGAITNTGHGVIFRTFAASHAEILNITGGPLSYKYRFSEIHIHFARTDEKGSEHLISGYQFPAEVNKIAHFTSN